MLANILLTCKGALKYLDKIKITEVLQNTKEIMHLLLKLSFKSLTVKLRVCYVRTIALHIIRYHHHEQQKDDIKAYISKDKHLLLYKAKVNSW